MGFGMEGMKRGVPIVREGIRRGTVEREEKEETEWVGVERKKIFAFCLRYCGKKTVSDWNSEEEEIK